MWCQESKQFETDVFRLFNQVVEPLVQCGYGSPGLLPFGLVLLETKGRQTGRVYPIPVVAKRWGDWLVVGTVRRDSQWIKNLTAHPHIQVWIGGRAQMLTAYVFDGEEQPTLSSRLMPIDQLLVQGLRLMSKLYGVRWAILIPEAVATAQPLGSNT